MRGRRVRGPLAWLVLAGALVAAASALAVVAARGPGGPGSFEERVDAVAATLRCPVCQDLSVADSPSPLAREMRAEVARQLRAGRSADEVRQWFVARYGDWILLSPPRRGLGLLVWAAPAFLLLLGLSVAFGVLRRWTRRPERASVAELTDEDRALLRRALAPEAELE